MKPTTIILLLSFLFSVNCMSQNSNKTNTKIANTGLSEITLTEQTRGHYRKITVTPINTDIVINSKKEVAKTSASDWKKISNSTTGLDLKKINELKAPSTKRFTDAAMMSSITIKSNNELYKSAFFDSENPPKELKTLYFLLFSKFKLDN